MSFLIEIIPRLLQGMSITLQLIVFSMPIGLVIGVAVALGRVYGGVVLSPLAWGYQLLFRGLLSSCNCSSSTTASPTAVLSSVRSPPPSLRSACAAGLTTPNTYAERSSPFKAGRWRQRAPWAWVRSRRSDRSSFLRCCEGPFRDAPMRSSTSLSTLHSPTLSPWSI